MKSPVTHKETVKHILGLSIEKIKTKYSEELGIDVSQYFKDCNEIQLFECIESKYRFYYPFNLLGDSSFYEALQKVQGGNYYPVSKWEYNEALKFIQPGDKILEIGCGVGHFLKQASAKGSEVTGLELNTAAVDICRSKGFDVSNEMLDVHAENNTAKYDVVSSFQVLEHITDVKNYIDDCLKVLKKGGYLIFAVPNSNPYLFRHDLYHTLNLPPHHAGLWNSESMRELPKLFPLTFMKLAYEPLQEYKKWFQVQLENYENRRPLFAGILRLLPRQIYKPLIWAFRMKIQGIYLVAIFKKN